VGYQTDRQYNASSQTHCVQQYNQVGNLKGQGWCRGLKVYKIMFLEDTSYSSTRTLLL